MCMLNDDELDTLLDRMTCVLSIPALLMTCKRTSKLTSRRFYRARTIYRATQAAVRADEAMRIADGNTLVTCPCCALRFYVRSTRVQTHCPFLHCKHEVMVPPPAPCVVMPFRAQQAVFCFNDQQAAAQRRAERFMYEVQKRRFCTDVANHLDHPVKTTEPGSTLVYPGSIASYSSPQHYTVCVRFRVRISCTNPYRHTTFADCEHAGCRFGAWSPWSTPSVAHTTEEFALRRS